MNNEEFKDSWRLSKEKEKARAQNAVNNINRMIDDSLKDKEKQQQDAVVQEWVDETLGIIGLVIQVAIFTLLCWPGFHYIASCAGLPSPGYMGSFGVMAIVQIVKRR